jgi:hypothetical protein
MVCFCTGEDVDNSLQTVSSSPAGHDAERVFNVCRNKSLSQNLGHGHGRCGAVRGRGDERTAGGRKRARRTSIAQAGLF